MVLLRPQSSVEVSVVGITPDLLLGVFARTVLAKGKGSLVERKSALVFRRLSLEWSGLLVRSNLRPFEVDSAVRDLLFGRTERAFCLS